VEAKAAKKAVQARGGGKAKAITPTRARIRKR
jgi:hypothetical protein